MITNTMFGAPAKQPLSWPKEVDHSWDMPVQASTFAEGTDTLYLFIFVVTVIAFIGILATMGWFMWAYRRKSPDQKTSSITHNGTVEFLWSAIPAVIMIVIFVWGELDFLKQATPPKDALEVRVIGRQWYWTVEYPSYPGVQLTSNVQEPQVTLIVPKGKPVRLTMSAEDVLHSFYIPAFRIKRDAIPGRYTNLWFEATKTGDFTIYCAEYCGDEHSRMQGIVRVLEPADFEAALQEAGRLRPEDGESKADYGKRIYGRKGCNACHSLDGNKAVGPTWKGVYGRSETLQDGATITVDDDYIKKSILEPNAQVVAGFTPSMPSFQGQLDDEQIAAVIEFIKTVK